MLRSIQNNILLFRKNAIAIIVKLLSEAFNISFFYLLSSFVYLQHFKICVIYIFTHDALKCKVFNVLIELVICATLATVFCCQRIKFINGI